MNKSFIYLACLLFLIGQISAQVIYERTYPYEFPSIQIPIELSDTSTFSLGNNSDCGGVGSRHIDVDGNELMGNKFGVEAFSSGYYWIGHDSVLIWAEEGALDVGPDSFRVYVWTPDEIKKILSIGVRYDFTPERRYGAYLYTTGRLLYEKSDTLYTKNLYTAAVEDSLIIPFIYHVIEFEKSILVFSDSESALLLNDHLEVIYEWQDLLSLTFNIDQAVVVDSFLVGKEGVNPTSIAMVNVYNESQQVMDLSMYFDQIEEIQANKNMLFVKGIFNGESQLLQLDSEFAVVGITKIDIPELNKELTFQYYPDRVYAWGYDGLANYKANYRMSYQYQDANPVKYLDIALDTMWVDSVYKYPEQQHLPIKVYISAVVRNFSPETIHSYTLHHEEIPVFYCDPGVYAMSFEDLTIEPNDSDTLSFQIWTYQYGSSFTRRFYVHHGNHHLDDEITNNNFQLTYLISGTGELFPLSITVYPNPFIDFFQTSVQTDLIQLNLYDQSGRLVSTGYDRLDYLYKLPSGIYFLQIQTGSSFVVERVVKVE